MNLQAKHCFRFLGIGAAVGLVGLVVFVVALMATKGSSVHDSITGLFNGINKPLEILPWAKDLAERQDPILSIGFIAVYWVTIGILIGGVAFAIWAFRLKTPGGSSGVPHKGS